MPFGIFLPGIPRPRPRLAKNRKEARSLPPLAKTLGKAAESRLHRTVGCPPWTVKTYYSKETHSKSFHLPSAKGSPAPTASFSGKTLGKKLREVHLRSDCTA